MYNVEEYLNSLPDDIPKISILHRRNIKLPSLERFTKLKYLECINCKITELPELPDSIETLYCGDNNLTYLPKLPSNLKCLHCPFNQLTELPELPNNLVKLVCYNNKLKSLPKIPKSLIVLSCAENELPCMFLNQYASYNMKQTYYKMKYGYIIRKKFMNFIKKRNQYINAEIECMPYRGICFYNSLNELLIKF